MNRHESVEPDLDYSKHYFYELYVASIVFNAFLNNSVSEQVFNSIIFIGCKNECYAKCIKKC